MIKIVQIVVSFLVKLLFVILWELLTNSYVLRFIDPDLLQLQDYKEPVLDILISNQLKGCKMYSKRIKIEDLRDDESFEKEVIELIKLLGCNDVFESYHDLYDGYSKLFRLKYRTDLKNDVYEIMVEIRRDDGNVKVNVTFCAFYDERKFHDFGIVGSFQREFHAMTTVHPQSFASAISAIHNNSSISFRSTKSANKV